MWKGKWVNRATVNRTRLLDLSHFSASVVQITQNGMDFSLYLFFTFFCLLNSATDISFLMREMQFTHAVKSSVGTS